MARKSKKWSQRAELKLRLPEVLRASLEYSAKERGDSMNSEIVKRLNSTFQYKQDDRTAKIVARALLTYLPEEVVNEMLEIIRREEREDAMADAAKEDWEERQREGDSK
jgi:hypothetical protein